MFCTPGYLIYAYKELFRNGTDGETEATAEVAPVHIIIDNIDAQVPEYTVAVLGCPFRCALGNKFFPFSNGIRILA